MQLTEKDIKTIKYEKRIGYVFSAMILLFGALINIFHFYHFLTEINTSLQEQMLINCIILGAAILVPFSMNKKFNQDLADDTKNIKLEKVQNKELNTSYEAGSASLPYSILAPKSFRREMRASLVYNLIINNVSYEVEKDIYDKVSKDSIVEMHYSKYSDTLLGIEIYNKF